MEVCVIGASNVDLISYVSRFPGVGETLHGSLFQKGFGGKGANQAVQASLLGSEVLFITKIGDDSFGKEYKEKFEEYGISTEGVFIANNTSTGVAPIMVDEKGNNSIIIVSGANDLLTFDEINLLENKIGECKILLGQLEIPLATTAHCLKLAHNKGIFTVLNTAPAPPSHSPIPVDLFPYIDLLCANEPEISSISNLPATNSDEALIAAKHVIDLGVKQVLLTLGANGCLLVSKDGKSTHIPAIKVDAIDTTGAGDSYLGAFAHFYALGAPIEKAMEKANVIAGQSVTKKGTQSSYSTKDHLPSDFFQF